MTGWPLQNKFRCQYSKIGNTPEQLFHAWRTFKFDENTNTIDTYILRMSQVVNNVRDTIDLAKRVFTKEKLDRQLNGQSSTPFMKASSTDNHSMLNSNKR